MLFDSYGVLLSAPLLLLFSGLTWRRWGAQPERFSRPRIRSVIGFLAQLLATVSVFLWAIHVFGSWVTGAFGFNNEAATLGLLFALAGLLLSPGGATKTRIYAVGLSTLMVLTWLAFSVYSRGIPL
jgi:hypothetical protein